MVIPIYLQKLCPQSLQTVALGHPLDLGIYILAARFAFERTDPGT